MLLTLHLTLHYANHDDQHKRSRSNLGGLSDGSTVGADDGHASLDVALLGAHRKRASKFQAGQAPGLEEICGAGVAGKPGDGVGMTTRKRPALPGRPLRNCIAVSQSTTVVRDLHRRRGASQPMVPLDCGCRDPWPCRCIQPPLSEHALDGWRRTARHVLATGHIPVVPLEVRRALWRGKGADRRLAELLHQGCGGVVA